MNSDMIKCDGRCLSRVMVCRVGLVRLKRTLTPMLEKLGANQLIHLNSVNIIHGVPYYLALFPPSFLWFATYFAIRFL